MRLVIALGGNALLKRGEPMLCENQRENVSLACRQIAKAYAGNELVVTHGNGPQVGLLALQNNAYKKVPMYPLDVIGAESVGMIGYMIQQELVNYVPKTATLATILTQTQVDPNDPAFQHPTKPVGPVYEKEEAEQLAKQHGWTIAPDNDKWRRVVPSPDPKRIWGLAPLKTLVENGHIVICCGGGGVPTYFDKNGRLVGAEAVIDKDLASSVRRRLFKPIRNLCVNSVLPRVRWGRKWRPLAVLLSALERRLLSGHFRKLRKFWPVSPALVL